MAACPPWARKFPWSGNEGAFVQFPWYGIHELRRMALDLKRDRGKPRKDRQAGVYSCTVY